jgi:hypothetical protein
METGGSILTFPDISLAAYIKFILDTKNMMGNCQVFMSEGKRYSRGTTKHIANIAAYSTERKA